MRLSLRLLAALVSCLAVIATAQAKNLEDQDWIRLTADGHTVYTYGDYHDANAILSGLYILSETAPRLFQLPESRPARPFRIILVDKKSEMKAVGLKSSSIVSQRTDFRTHSFVIRDWPAFNELSFLLREYAERLVLYSDDHASIHWVRQGLANYLAGTSWTADEVTYGNRPAHLTDAMAYRFWLSADRLLTDRKEGDFNREMYSRYVGQTWVLVHYLVSVLSREHSVITLLRHYRGLVDSGMDEATALYRTTGIEPDKLVSTLKGHNQTCCRIFQIDASSAFSEYSVSRSDVSREEISLLLAEQALHNKETEAARRWIGIAATDENLASRARMLRGKLFLQEGDMQAAKTQFEAAVEQSPESIEAKIALGRFWIERARDADDLAAKQSAAQNARRLLVAAWKLDDQSPEVYYLNAQSYLVAELNHEKAVEMLDAAAYQQPFNLQILQSQAETLIAAGRQEEAVPVAETIARLDRRAEAAELEASIVESRSEEVADEPAIDR